MGETLTLDKYINLPIDVNCRTLFNHLGRYFYAMKKLNITKNDVVIDASCGQGYGAYNIALNSQYVYGIDINEENLYFAKKNFYLLNLEYLTYFDFNKKISLVDKIIIIETIEHLKSISDIEEYLGILFLYLKKKGQIFLTFPVGENKKSEYNEFHLCEPDIKSIHDIVKKYFSVIEIETSKFINNYDKETEYCFMRCIK